MCKCVESSERSGRVRVKSQTKTILSIQGEFSECLKQKIAV